MPNAKGFLGWAYVTGTVASIQTGVDGRLAYYNGNGNILNDASGLYWNIPSETLQVSGNLDV